MQPRLEAEQRLLAIEAAFVPSMTDADRAGLVNRLVQQARGETVRAKSAVEAFAEAGIKVVHVPATPPKRRKRTSAATGHGGTRRKGRHERIPR